MNISVPSGWLVSWTELRHRFLIESAIGLFSLAQGIFHFQVQIADAQ